MFFFEGCPGGGTHRSWPPELAWWTGGVDQGPRQRGKGWLGTGAGLVDGGFQRRGGGLGLGWLFQRGAGKGSGKGWLGGRGGGARASVPGR